MNSKAWAVEGLAYLTMYGDIKESVAYDDAVLKALFALERTDDRPLQYGVVTILSNLCYYQKKLTEEQEQMIKLKEIAKEPVPKFNTYDTDDYVTKRAAHLVKVGRIRTQTEPRT